VLLHLVDASAAAPVKAWRTVRDELDAYGGGLIDKPEILALSKADLVTPTALAAKKRALEKASGVRVHVLSAATRQGVDEVLDALIELAGRDAATIEAESRTWAPL
jgi:GTP-binding protein